MKKSKKGIVTLTTFSLVLLILLSLLTFSYYYKERLETKTLERNFKVEVLNSASSFRSQIIDVVRVPRSNITYNNKYDDEQIYFELSEDRIYGIKQNDRVFVNLSVSMMGVNFCENMVVSPKLTTVFSFNGSCIEKVYEERTLS